MLPRFLFASCLALSWLLTRAVRRYALSHDVIDVPNERSSHDRPTPRGGGAAIVVTFVVACICLYGARIMPGNLAAALIGGAAAISIVGWLDDRRGLHPLVRFGVHLAAAIWALAWLHGMTGISLGALQLHLGFIGTVVAAVFIVWCINLYNFMDGIDGIAAGQTVAVAGAGGLFILSHAAGNPIGIVALALAGSAAGFLIWNWAPARIFMGDTGSGFIGYIFGALMIASERAHALPLTAWLLLSAVFIFDATATLMRRVLRGEKWYSAHRQHAYQRLVQLGWSHGAVTTAVLFVDVALAALAWNATNSRGDVALDYVLGLALVVTAYLLVERSHPMRPASADVSERNDACDPADRASSDRQDLTACCSAALRGGYTLMQHQLGHQQTTPPALPRASFAAIAAHDDIVDSLRSAFPDDAIRSRQIDTGTHGRVWHIDPLDGAAGFDSGRGDFCVMVALVEDDAPRVAAVYAPAADVLYFAMKDGGAYRSDGKGALRLTCTPARLGPRSAGASSQDDMIASELFRHAGFSTTPTLSSLGLACARVAEGCDDLFIQAAGTLHEWQTAAPDLILSEAAGSMTDCRGARLEYNQPTPVHCNGVLAAHPTWIFRVMPALAGLLKTRLAIDAS